MAFKKVWFQHLVFTIVDKKHNKLTLELLLYCVFCHLFYCICRSQSVKRCQLCTKFFVDKEIFVNEIKKSFNFILTSLGTSFSEALERCLTSSTEQNIVWICVILSQILLKKIVVMKITAARSLSNWISLFRFTFLFRVHNEDFF